MEDSKDRLGSKLKDREKAAEDLYIEEQERLKREKLRAAQAAAPTFAGKGACPWCGTPLVHTKLHGIGVEQCPKDCGIWIALTEIETLAERERDGWLSKYFYRPRLEG